MAAAKVVMYRDHKLYHNPDSGFAKLFGGAESWWSYSGPHANGGGSGGLRAAKKSVDDAIRRHECNAATKHANQEERNGRMFCKDCGSLLGYPYTPGQGATFSYFRTAANGHDYGWSKTKDTHGKWFAIDLPRGNPQTRGPRRLVKCATRAKAKAKATEWWLAAKRKKNAKVAA